MLLNSSQEDTQNARCPSQFLYTRRQKKCSENPSQRRDSWHLIMNWLKAVEPGTEESRCEVCPLTRVKAGVAVRIKQLCASPELQNRLRELGLCEDQIIRLLTSPIQFHLPGLQCPPRYRPATGSID